MALVLLVLAAVSLAGLTWKVADILARKQDRLVAMELALTDRLADTQQAKIKQAAMLEQQKIVEKSVDTGTASAEVIHKTVADVTFSVLDAIPATESVSKLARGLHDGIADTIYSTVKTSNVEVGNLTKGFIKLKGEYDASRRKRPNVAEESTPAGDESGAEPKTDSAAKIDSAAKTDSNDNPDSKT